MICHCTLAGTAACCRCPNSTANPFQPYWPYYPNPYIPYISPWVRPQYERDMEEMMERVKAFIADVEKRREALNI